MSQNNASRIGILAAIAIVGVVSMPLSGTQAEADTGGWSTPVNLSNSPLTWSTEAQLAADSMGGIHVVWGEDTIDPPSPRPTARTPSDTMYYTYYDGTGWTEPVDFIVSPEGSFIYPVRLRTQRGTLYTLWVNDQVLSLSLASIGQADSARNWRSMEIPTVGPVRYADFDILDDDSLRVAYTTLDGAVHAVEVSAPGYAVGPETLVWLPSDSAAYSTVSVRTDVGDDTTWHLVWTMTAKDLEWNTYGVAYARSTDNGVTWQDEWRTSDNGDDATVISNGSEVYVLWNRSAYGGSRPYRHSGDGGATWSHPVYLYPGYYGKTGFPGVGFDSADRLHRFSSTGNGVGLYHSSATGDEWTEPEAVISPGDPTGERPTFAISQGNRLHAAWMDFNTGDIWYTTRVTDASVVPPTPFVVDSSSSLGAQTGQSMSTGLPTGLATGMPTPVAEVQPTSTVISPTMNATVLPSSGTWSPLLLSVVPVLSLIGVVFVIWYRQRKR